MAGLGNKDAGHPGGGLSRLLLALKESEEGDGSKSGRELMRKLEPGGKGRGQVYGALQVGVC